METEIRKRSNLCRRPTTYNSPLEGVIGATELQCHGLLQLFFSVPPFPPNHWSDMKWISQSCAVGSLAFSCSDLLDLNVSAGSVDEIVGSLWPRDCSWFLSWGLETAAEHGCQRRQLSLVASCCIDNSSVALIAKGSSSVYQRVQRPVNDPKENTT